MFGLCVKKFRRNPHLAPDVAAVMKDVNNVTVSRAALKRQKQEDMARSNEGLSIASSRVVVPVHNTPPIDNATTKKLLWAKVLASKSQAENTNILAKRMGKMEELEKAMTLLDKMREVIGDDNYKAKVASVLDAFPVFSTYDACVDIIDVDADDDDGQPDLPPVTTVLKTPSTRQSAPSASILVTSGSDCIVDERDRRR